MEFIVILVSVLVQSVLSQNNDSCCRAPVSFFALSRDLKQGLFPGITNDFYLIRAGVIDPIFSLDISSQLYLRSDIVDFPLVLYGYQPGVYFNMTVTSSNPSLLQPPLMLPFNSGTLPTSSLRVHVLFECSGTASEVVRVNVVLNTMLKETGMEYCTLHFTFGKHCDEQTSIGSGLLADYMELMYINDSIDIPPYRGCNDTGNMTTIRPSQPNVIVPIVSSIVPLTVVIMVATTIGIIIWLIIYYRLKQRRKQLELEAVGRAFQLTHDTWTPKKEPHKKEFPQEKLTLKRELGEGAFGIVYEGEAEGIIEEGVLTPVAVKQLRNMEAMDDFFREVTFMSKFEHEKIVCLLGVCTLQEPYAMIFEYMDLGDLCSFLRDAALLGDEKGGAILTQQQLMEIAIQIAEGMKYISSTKLVHRDLAARNCLVATGLIIKIGDFGMSRNLYTSDYYKVQGSALLPIRWMSPESIRYGKFSEATDVYSFGVLLWEIFTLGQQPFAGHSNDEVIEMIGQGQHLDIPQGCLVKQVMLDCWQWRSKDRPTFEELYSHLCTLYHDMNDEEIL